MDTSSEFVSVFKINGRPLLPPAMTPRRRKEMQEYKEKALAVELRLKEKKGQREFAGNLLELNEDGNKENKKKERVFTSKNEDSIFDARNQLKCVLSERESLKEIIPQFFQKSIDKNSTMTCDLPNYGDYQEEAYSVALTESTDLHPYLNSSLEDEICSSEADCAAESSSLLKHAEDTICCDPIRYSCNSEENLGRSYITDGPLSGFQTFHVSSVSSPETNVIDTTRVINKLHSQITFEDIADGVEADDLASSCRSSIFYEGEVKLTDDNVENNKNNEGGCCYPSFPSSPSPNASGLANDSNADRDVAALQEISTETSSLNYCPQLQNQPARLIRTGSFTLETPSPLLIANIEQFTVDALLQDDNPTNAAENNAIDCHQVNPEDMNTECRSSENQKALHLFSSKDGITKRAEERKPGVQKSQEASVVHSKREPVKGGIPRGSVFDRLTADAAKKAEERRKLNRKNITEVFKVPKKVTKIASRRMRSSVSASNLRISLSGTHKSRSNSLACKRSNSEANISSVNVKSISLAPSTLKQKQNILTQRTSTPPLQNPVVLKSRSSLGKDVEPVVGIFEDIKSLPIVKDKQSTGMSDECTLTKLPVTQSILTFPSHSNNSQEFEAPHLKKVIYCVQTSPISPPAPFQTNESTITGNGYADSEVTALQGGRQRRRWSVGWSGWVSSSAEQPESDSPENDIEKCINAEPLEPECEGLDASKSELESDCHDECIHSSKESVNMSLHVVNNSQESLENRAEIELQSSVAMRIEKICDPEIHFPENLISTSSESGSCDMKESFVNTPEEASCVITHSLTPKLENHGKGSVLQANSDNLCNNNSVSFSETMVKPIKIPPSLEKTLNLLPASPAGTVGIKETALKLLGCLVEEQDKAMVRLLDDQRQQAEKMKEQFKIQQKCLVDRVANLVSSLSTPQSRKSKTLHSPKLGEGILPAPEENVLISRSPTIFNQCLSVTQPLTPQPISRLPVSTVNQISPCSSKLELSQPRIDESLIEKSSKYMVNELESKLTILSQNEDLPFVENSFCQVCLSVQSNCRCCSQEESSCSSTIREEITALSVGSLENITVDAGGNCHTECNSTKDEILCSSSPFQEKCDSNLIQSSVKPEKSVSVSYSSVRTISAPQEGDLDLSEILDMENGRRGGTTKSQISPSSNEKSKRKLEGIHGSTILSAAHSVKTIDGNPTMSPLENVSLYQQIYEQDLQRLTTFESNVEKESKDIDGLLENESVSSMKHNLRSPESWTLMPDKIPSLQGKTNEDEKKDVQFDMLPDIRSDILHAYLGSQTPSTGPVFLQTPMTSVAHQYQVMPACSTPGELCENSALNGLLLKEVANCLKDNHSSPSLRPVVMENLECKESLDLSPNELHLSIRSTSSSSSMSFPHGPSQPFSESHPSSSDSHSSEHYTTASSKCYSEDFSRLDKSMLFKFGKLSALIKGYLTRRLLKTEKVRRIKVIIRDLMMTALKVHSEVSQEDNVNPNDVRLHGQILAELNATCEEFHRVFFEMTKAEQMAVISVDRQRLLSSSGSTAVVDVGEVITPRPALLSAVTLKTLQRRFSMYSPKNGNKDTAKYRCDSKKPTQRKIPSVALGAGQRMVKTTKCRERGSVRPTSRALSISEDLTSKSVSRNMKTSNVSMARKGSVQPKPSRRKRRSASAGEINRKPWR